MLLSKHPVTHVLLDISMPTLGGVDVLIAIKRTRHLRRLKLFAYTADALYADEKYLRLIGFDDVLLKPLQRDRLLAVLGLSDLKVEV
jgi:putative two-component system response regulator